DEAVRSAIDGGRRRIDEAHAMRAGVLEQRQRVPVIVLHHVAPVGLHRVRAGALVEDQPGVAIAVEVRQEFLLVDVVDDLAVDEHAVYEVAQLVGPRQVVGGNDVALAPRVQRAHEIAADESGRAGDDDHSNNSSGSTAAVPSFPTTMPPARLARRTASAIGQPAASIAASTATTVSPAPETS